MGYYYQSVSEQRTFTADLPSQPVAGASAAVVHIPLALTVSDHAVSAFVGRRLTSTIAASVGVTPQWHRGCSCDPATITRTTYQSGAVRDTLDVNREYVADTDVGLSVGLAWQARPALRVGLAGTNVVGSANAIATQPPRDRSVGVGLAWFHARLHLGADVENSDIRGVTSSVGASVVTPWRDLAVRAGYVTGVDAVRAGVTIKRFDYAAVHTPGAWAHHLGVALRF